MRKPYNINWHKINCINFVNEENYGTHQTQNVVHFLYRVNDIQKIQLMRFSITYLLTFEITMSLNFLAL